jgi:formylglycine-generating enzyme required for sulfatase activity
MLGPGTGQEAQRRRDVEADGKAEAEAKRPEEEHRRLPWPIRRSALLLGCLAGVVAVCAIGAWFVLSPGRTPVAPLAAAQERALKPGDTFQECSNCPLMMVVPAGSFIMGSPAGEPGRFSNEDPQHEVTIASPFAVGQYELRFDEWDACVADGGCNGFKPPDQGWGRKDRPAINVSWVDAHAYVSWLAKKTGKPYRLLTEAEYEYATRAGAQTAYPWGNAVVQNNANCTGCGGQWNGKETAPVGSFAANGFGLYDMAGNVWEWTQTWYAATSAAPLSPCCTASDDAPPPDSFDPDQPDVRIPRKVVKGGSYLCDANFCDRFRPAARQPQMIDTATTHIGFRCAAIA